MRSAMQRAMHMLVAALAIAPAPVALASVQFPAMEIMALSGNAGATAGAYVGSTLSVGATGLLTLAADGSTLLDFPDTPFNLQARRTGAYTFGPGTLSVGSLLSASFQSLTVTSLPVGATFSADLTFTGGSLVTVQGSGRIEGAFGAAMPSASIDPSRAFSAPTVTAKIGAVNAPVVPLPAAAWMFGAGCLAVFGPLRRGRRQLA